MRRLLSILTTGFLIGCAVPSTLVARPPEGYEALRVTQSMQVTAIATNRWELPAGTILVGDRRQAVGGAQLYCGSLPLGDSVLSRMTWQCATFDGENLVVSADMPVRSGTIRISQGEIERIRMR